MRLASLARVEARQALPDTAITVLDLRTAAVGGGLIVATGTGVLAIAFYAEH